MLHVFPDPGDPATESQPKPLPSYTAGLSAGALSGKKIAVVSSTTVPYPAAVTELETLGAKPTTVTPGAAAKAPSVIPYEFHRDLDSFLASTSGPKSLQAVTEYNSANAAEGLKFGQGSLLSALAVEYTNPATTSASRTEPPGWATQRAPAFATSSSPSRKGKKASDAQAVPRSRSPPRAAAIFTDSTRLVCPPPTARIRSALEKTMALLFTCLQTRHPKRRAAISAAVGVRRVTTFHSVEGSTASRSCASSPPEMLRSSIEG